MAFFDNFTKKVGEIAQATASKSKELAEITKLTMSISSEEDIIKKTYFEMGKLFYSQMAESAEGEMKEFVVKIDDANARIADFREKIALAKLENAKPVEEPVPTPVVSEPIAETQEQTITPELKNEGASSATALQAEKEVVVEQTNNENSNTTNETL